MRTLAAALAALALAPLAAAATVEELEARLRADPAALEARVALAEAYLHECFLEKSLAQWQAVLRRRPDHPRARLVVRRLTAQALDLDTHLDTLDRLIEQGITEGTGELLDAAGERAATDSQKARILYLRGALAARRDEPARSRASFQAAARLYPKSRWAARATIALAEAESCADQVPEAIRLLRSVLDDAALDAPEVKELARLRLLLLQTRGMTRQERIAALRELVPRLAEPAVTRQALDELAQALTAAQGRWVPEAVDAVAATLEAEPPAEAVEDALSTLRQVARESREPATLDRVLAALDAAPHGPPFAREAAFVRVEALLARAAAEDERAAMGRFVRQAHQVLDAQADGAAVRARVQPLRGEALLLEAQKLVALDGPVAALPVLTRAKDHYLAILPSDPPRYLACLFRIGRLLEKTREWETAVALYRETATRYPHTPQGRDALLKVAQLLDGRLGAPLEALDVYARYAARYPAELPYRQLHVGQRLRRLGYANVLDFQKRNRLKPDGIFGPASRRKLEELEETFDLIRLRGEDGEGILRGKFVHQTMFAIARRLDERGRDHDAVAAYRLFLSLFPTKREADDALLAVARIFADNLLFQEALGAYAELMEDFPKGDKTSEAYVEAARCHENLGHWDQAKALYELYAKKFPKYKHVALCKARIPLLEEIRQYQDFIATNPQNPKRAEAQYQIATLLYKEFENHTKAAVEFAKVPRRHPQHVRAPDALFTAGVAQMRAQNFPAARQLFAQLVQSYPDTRLTDDAQFWIGHTYEYAARALGKLDEARIVLRKRTLESRARLLADLALRRHYHPEAQPGPDVPQDVWGGDTLGVLASGSVRDRVNADLFRAIRAYQVVVDRFEMGDMVGKALLRTGTIYTKYLKDPEKGMAAFQQLLEHHPGSKEAVGALFEVGAYHLEKENFDQAITVYQKFVYNYPQDPKVEDAMVAIARCYIAKKAWDKALDACQSYLNRFPEGKHAAFAKNQATWIRMYHF
ncbi:MAG: tetratricopeptide repeat protein [Candidatus Brocadiia bacterium]